VVPPSVYSAATIESDQPEKLEWACFGEPAAVDYAVLERTVYKVAAAALLARHWPRKGSRHDVALAIGGGLANAGWPPAEIEAFLRAVCVAAKTQDVETKVKAVAGTHAKAAHGEHVTGWPRVAQIYGYAGAEIVDRVRTWLGTERRKGGSGPRPRTVRAIAPYQPFPVDDLPLPINEFVRQASTALGCDPSYVALPSLAVLGSAIGNTRTIRVKRGWLEPSVLWSCIVGDSGTLKSPAYLQSVGHLFQLQKRLFEQYRQTLSAYQEQLARHQAAKRQGGDAGSAPERPVLCRVVCSDTTIEKLAEILEDNPRGTLLARDELAGWFGSFTRYKGKQGGSDLPAWLEFFRAGPWLIDRKTGDRPSLYVPRAAVSVCGGIQPEVLTRSLTTDFLNAGLPARILMAWPPKLAKVWSEVEVHPDVESAFTRTVSKLLALNFDKGADGERRPHALGLSADAKAIWVAFYNAWAREQAAAEGELAAAFSKLEAYAARFTLLHHVVTYTALDVDDLREIGSKSVEAGIRLCHWFAAEARRIYATLTESADERDARRLIEWVRSRGGRVTAKELQRSNSRKYPIAETATLALDALAEARYGEWVDRPPDAKGGRPTRDFVLRPTTDETDETGDGDDGGDGGLPTGPSDETPPAPSAAPKFPDNSGVSEVSWVSPFVGQVVETSDGERARSTDRFEVSSDGWRVSSDSRVRGEGYTLIRRQGDLQAVLQALDESATVGIDVETTGLNRRTDKVRLLTLATERGTWLVDCFAVDLVPLFSQLTEKTLVAHNAAFDLGFLMARGFVPDSVRDTMLMSQVLYAGQVGPNRERLRHTLQDCVGRELGQTLNKGLQDSDWSRTLTREQLEYATLDAQALVPLAEKLEAKIKVAQLEGIADLEHRCLPALVWLGRSGVAFSTDTWQGLVARAEAASARLGRELDLVAPAAAQPAMFGGAWNWDSPEQVKQALAAVGCPVESTDDDALAKVNHPLAGLLRDYREGRKKCTTYGKDWLQHVADDGRVYASWRQIGAASGRMSCSAPNLQQLPRGDYRKCFQAPPGRVLVKADYSQIELRIAAKVSGDAAMLAAYQAGQDLHTLTAQRVLGIGQVSREQRQLAKALNFGLLYGMGARGFQSYAKSTYGVELTPEQATAYRDAFFNAYPGLRRWHRSQPDQTIATRTLLGRRRLHVEKFTEKLNTPVQGTGADGLKQALALLWERREQVPGAFPVLAVHDEIVIECDTGQAQAVSAWLRQAMIDGFGSWLDPVAVDVEVKIAPSWGA
jgi:DNA polymerase I-like protein with 3'-5' exonuclease and polymerase domains